MPRAKRPPRPAAIASPLLAAIAGLANGEWHDKQAQRRATRALLKRLQPAGAPPWLRDQSHVTVAEQLLDGQRSPLQLPRSDRPEWFPYV